MQCVLIGTWLQCGFRRVGVTTWPPFLLCMTKQEKEKGSVVPSLASLSSCLPAQQGQYVSAK